METIIDEVRFICSEEISEEEARAYVARGRVAASEAKKELVLVEAKIIDQDVELTYQYATQPFERIRRITGYLVGTLERFNDAKRAEESDRIKHDIH